MQAVHKAIEHTRGSDFSVTVAYNSYNDHISYHNITMPAGASKEVREAFLEEAERAMLNLIDSEWGDDATMYNGLYKGMME